MFRLCFRLFECVEEFKYFVTLLINQNCIHEEIKRRLKSGNICYRSLHNRLSSSLLPININKITHRNIILPVVYGCETWSVTLRKQHKLRAFENTALQKIFWRKGARKQGSRED
jgi:hypothetical protein